MTRARIFLFSIVLPLSAVAQQPGVLTEWDVQKVVETIAAQTARLQPLIAEIRPNRVDRQGSSRRLYPAVGIGARRGADAEAVFR